MHWDIFFLVYKVTFCLFTFRGCAKKSQCVDPVTKTLFQGSYTSNGTSLVNMPAGMTVKPYCCENLAMFSNDDILAVDVTKICNSAPGGAYSVFTSFGVVAQVLVATVLAITMAL